jgi:hypothetical protein
MFMRVQEVVEALDVSEPYAYKLIRKLNEELKQKGCIVIAGRIDRRFFYEKFYNSAREMVSMLRLMIPPCAGETFSEVGNHFLCLLREQVYIIWGFQYESYLSAASYRSLGHF